MIRQCPAMPRRKIALAFVALCFVLPAARPSAQSIAVPTAGSDTTKATDPNAKLPEYDVASVKENKSGDGHGEYTNTPDGLRMTNIPLKIMIAEAYGINQEFISGGPGWVDSTGYDLDAKVAGEDVPELKQLTHKQRMAMLQPLLAERFHLKAHVEEKILPIYELRVAKAGPKLTPSIPITPSTAKPREGGAQDSVRAMFGPGHFEGHGVGISVLVASLPDVVHRRIIDKTGLTGTYDFDVKYAPEDEHGGGSPDNGTSDQVPSVFTALEEQLGLKLQSSKGPVETLVIDQVEKPAQD